MKSDDRSKRPELSRRGFLKGLGIGAGAAIGTRLPGAGWIGEAKAAIDEPTAVVVLHFLGGYNAIFASADRLVGHFGVTAGNHTVLGRGLAVDNTYANSMSAFVKGHMAAVGVTHGISNHPGAHEALWTHNKNNAGLVLASAMGGSASIKAAVIGGNMPAEAPDAPVNNVSFQAITDMQRTVDALGGGIASPRVPDRTIGVADVQGARTMSGNILAGSPKNLASLANGYPAAIDTLKLPVKQFDLEELKTAYKLANTSSVRTFESKLAAAELMVRAGTNVVTVLDRGWDSHGDIDGSEVRNMMTSYVLGPLNTFLTRMVEDPTRTVVVVMMGDFSRSLPKSNHQPNLTATVIAKGVKQGTTGRVAPGLAVTLPAGTPGIGGMWSYIAALTKVGNGPFGPNQHPSIIL